MMMRHDDITLKTATDVVGVCAARDEAGQLKELAWLQPKKPRTRAGSRSVSARARRA